MTSSFNLCAFREHAKLGRVDSFCFCRVQRRTLPISGLWGAHQTQWQTPGHMRGCCRQDDGGPMAIYVCTLYMCMYALCGRRGRGALASPLCVLSRPQRARPPLAPLDAPMKRHRHWHLLPATTRRRALTKVDAPAVECTTPPLSSRQPGQQERRFSRPPSRLGRKTSGLCLSVQRYCYPSLISRARNSASPGRLARHRLFVGGRRCPFLRPACQPALASSSFGAPSPTFVPASILATGAL